MNDIIYCDEIKRVINYKDINIIMKMNALNMHLQLNYHLFIITKYELYCQL